MALSPKCLRRIKTLIIVLYAATSGYAFADNKSISAITFKEISKKHADCHLLVLSINQTNQNYLPPGLQCITTTETSAKTIVEQSSLTRQGVEYNCYFTLTEHQEDSIPNNCHGTAQSSIPSTAPARRHYYVPGNVALERHLPGETTEALSHPLLTFLFTSKRLIIDYAYYTLGNGFELYCHLWKKPFKIWRRYSKSLRTVTSQIKTMNSFAVRHQKNPIQQLWINILDSAKFVALTTWNIYEIYKHLVHFLNVQHTHEFSEGETTLQLSSASFELYEESEDFLDALKNMPGITKETLEDLALYTLIVYNGYEAIASMPEEKSITSYLYKLARDGILYVLNVPSSRYRDCNKLLISPQDGSSQPAVRGPELRVPLVRSYHDIRYY